MLSPVSLVRLRPWIFRLQMGALILAGAVVLIRLFVEDPAEPLKLIFTSCIVLLIASACALTCLAYANCRERTWPALIGLALIAPAAIKAILDTWRLHDFDLDEIPEMLAVWAVAWTFILLVFSRRLPSSLEILPKVTAASIAGLTLMFTFDRVQVLGFLDDERLSGALWTIALIGVLTVIALEHHYRAGVRALVPMAHVASVLRAKDFYQQLGFRCENSFTPPDAPEPTWAWMETPGGAQLMLVCAEEPVIAAQQGVLFYVYCDDLPTKHAELTGKGIEVGPIERPFYAPRGECLLKDPDGYSLMLTHT